MIGPNELLQFETLDIYLTPDVGYTTPALLFYAGPAVSRNDDRSSLTNADYIAITATSQNSIELDWRLGPNNGSTVFESFSISTSAEIFLTRVGTQLELQASGGTLQRFVRNGVEQQNCSLVFKPVPNTVYYIGGRPEGIELVSSVPAAVNSFIGTYQLILFNGDLWTLWDYRSRSNTNFFDFNTHSRTENTVWFPSPTGLQGELLSFDGNGYVQPIVMATQTLGDSAGYQFYFRARSTEGLLAYMFDRERNVSMEVAFSDGQLHVEMRWNGEIIRYSRTMVNTDLEPQSANQGDLIIQYSAAALQVSSTSRSTLFRQGRDFQSPFRSFGNLRSVKAWFGGIDPSMLEEPFVPRITRQGFRGCFTFELVSPGPSVHVFDFGFLENYLMSQVQQQISGNCIRTVSISCYIAC